MARENWYIYVEGLGETREPDSCCADHAMVELLQRLKRNGHTLLQARYGSNRGEENLLDPAYMDLHEDLVRQGVAADAARIQSSAEVGLRAEGQQDEGGKGGAGVHSSDAEESVQEPAREEEHGKKKDSKTTHGRRA